MATHPFGNIHQTPEWGHFQVKVPSRGKYWIVVVETEPGKVSTGEAAYSPQSVRAHNLESLPGHTPSILAGALIVRHSLPKGYCWLYAPRGPLLNYENDQEAKKQMEALTGALKQLAKQEKAIFWRIDPALPLTAELSSESTPHAQVVPSAQTSHLNFAAKSLRAQTFSPLHFPHFRFIDHGFQPNDTLVLDLEKGEPQLLAEMKPKGRYNIKLAEKKGVKVHITDPSSQNFQSDIDAFYKILQETTMRDGFSGHPKKYYEDMLKTLSPLLPRGKNSREQDGFDKPINDGRSLPGQRLESTSWSPSAPHAQLYLATFENQVIAGLLATTYNGTTIYYYGASGAAHRNLMGPYLLQWQAIRDAKAAHCHTYDFLGIAPPQSEGSASQRERNEVLTTSSIERHSEMSKFQAAHPWAGVTDFKKKFGGQSITFQPPQEYVFKPLLYRLYRLYKRFR